MVEKGSHPRFALGESSTPLANLTLERLAVRYQLEDLYELAAYGRWRDKLPHAMRGLKRGFTFYRQRPFAGDRCSPQPCSPALRRIRFHSEVYVALPSIPTVRHIEAPTLWSTYVPGGSGKPERN